MPIRLQESSRFQHIMKMPMLLAILIKPRCLSWKEEIDALISGGVRYDDMCMNDMHQHSTPLAGYVGAHLIYRNLFDKIPLELGDGAPLYENRSRRKILAIMCKQAI